MNKSFISLCFTSALCLNVYADSTEDISKQLKDLQTKIKKLEKKLSQTKKIAIKAKKQSSFDNIKWDVDLRTQIDNIQYKHANGSKSKNEALMTNRLWLGAKYQADDNTIFRAKLSYNKAFGDSANHSQSNTNPGHANFDWVTNENALDNSLKVKEAYWLYKNDTFLGADVPWAVSIGRRPSTDGLPINLRNNQKANSPLSHIVDVEFDGFSLKFDTEELTGWTGSWFKLCAGRGLTNATPRFDMFNPAYSKDETKNEDIDMLGFIAVPYDDGQYSFHMNYAKAWNLIGYDKTSLNNFNAAYNNYQSNQNATTLFNMQNAKPSFKDVGDIEFATVLFKSEGIGDGISDFLDDTTIFTSFAMSKTNPNNIDGGMLGSLDRKTGTSIWLGINSPSPFRPDDTRIGIEFNKGSKYFRSMTYAEDTYAGSKIAARGSAWEIYRHQQLTKALSFSLSYTHIKYDYTGSNAFFGADGTPLSISEAKNAGLNPVEEARDLKAYIRYKF